MHPPADWWKTFFSGLALEAWRRAVSPEQTRAECDFIQRTLGLSPAARILDVPCGFGRVALELARRGHPAHGIDLAGPYVEEARSRAAEEQLPAVFEQRDMRDLPRTAEFDAAVCWGNSFGYLDDDGNRDFLRAVARALKPGGRFLLDLGVLAESLLPHFQERPWYEFGGMLFLIHNHYDPARGRLDTECVMQLDGRTERKQFSHRIFTYRELCQLLNEAGFGECRGYASPDGEPFRLGARRALLVATVT